MRPSSCFGHSARCPPCRHPYCFPTPCSVKHNNNTGRWIIPFRAVWAPSADGLLVGGMGRTVDVYDAARGTALAALASPHMTAIPSRIAPHPGLPVLAAATASGRINVWRAGE